jgi:hypothetical protein
MKAISSTEAKTHFGALLDIAQREPLTIHKKCRAVAESAMRWDRRQRENAAPTPVI